MKDLEGVNLEGKKILLRTDINLPIEEGEPRETVRFRRYMETVKQLSDRGGRILVIAHQGRPARNDFLSLERHSELMEEYLEKEVKFVRCFFGDEIDEKVSGMENGGVALLENIRFLSEELQNADPDIHARDVFVEEISSGFEIYVDDAFSTAHRSHGSMVGFTRHLESYPGPIMRKELEKCGMVRDEVEDPVLVLGGEKPADVIGMMDEMIEDAEKVLLGGIPGELALAIEGHELGQKYSWIQDKGFDKGREKLESLLEDHGDKIETPRDLATESGNYSPGEVPEDERTWDIGEKTAERYTEVIKNADSVVMKGPMGAFEEHPEGSKKVLEAIADSEGFSVIGGGHTSSLVQRFGLELEDFDHVSIAGGAFVRFMSGEKLPAVEALKN